MQNSAAVLINKLQRSINVVHNPVSGWVILLFSLLLTFAAYWFTNRQVMARAEEHFLFRSNEIMLAIRQRLMLYEQALQGGRGLFNASVDVSHSEWRRYVESLHLKERLPGIQGLGFAAVVLPHQLEAHEAEVRAMGFPDYAVKPDGPRELYTAIVFLEPFNWRNRRAFGYDMWSNDVRRSAMAKARDTGQPAMSGLITLVQETNRNVQRGFLIYVPVYAGVAEPADLESRRSLLRGWVYAPFRMGDLMDGILGAADANINFSIYDTDLVSEDTLLLHSDGGEHTGGTAEAERFLTRVPLVLLGRSWTVTFAAPKKALMHSQDQNQPLYVLIAGVIIDLLLFYVIVSLHYINRHARRTHKQLQREFDLNQRSLAEQTRLVETTEKEANTFFELAPAAFLVVSQRGLIVRANHSAHELFGFDMGTLVGRRIEDLLPDDMQHRHTALREEYFRSPSTRVMGGGRTFNARKRDGQVFPSAISLVPVELREETHVVAVVLDLSQQKQVEQTLEDAREKAESASRAKTEFVANMSHEIRTPLNAVLGAAQLLERADHNEDQARYIRMIRSSGEALLGVINDILDFSKIEAGRMELTRVNFDLDEVLSRVAVMMSVNAGEKDIELVIRIEPTVNRQLVGDPLRLQQVLLNLVSNAIKFTREGEVVLSVETDSGSGESPQALHFSVRDTGIGMTLLQQTRIFKAFTQADASITRRFGGTGLGLVISNRIVSLMGSQLRVVSDPGVGSEFSFEVTLPVASGVAKPRSGRLQVPQQVLLVDDNQESQTAIKAILDQWGWPLTLCVDCAAAREVITTQGGIDVLLLACGQLPDFLAQDLAVAADCRRILLIRNNQRALMMSPEKQARFDAVIVKPVLEATLLSALEYADRQAAGDDKRTQESLNASGQLAGVRILLVEDNPFNQMVAEGLLEDMGATVSMVNNGEEALAFVAQSPEEIDVILMDIQMPVMDGLTATHQLRERGHRHPIIAMTAGVLASERDRYLKAGMNDLVPKPVDAQQLWQAINLVRTENAVCLLPESVSPVVAPKVFNRERLEKLTRGRRERVRSVVHSLAEIEQTTGRELAEGLELLLRGDVPEARRKFHSIKGVVANYGGEQAAATIQQLEDDMDTGATLAELQNRVALLREHLSAYTELARQWSRAQEQLYG
jgi:PAS domain S-box-containing protein